MSGHLIRGIGQWDFVALVVNITIGAGILGLPSKLFALMGIYSLAAIICCAVLVLLLILCFAEVGSRFSGTGGPYLYTLSTLGPLTGFIAGWLLWLSRLFSFASVCNLFVDYSANIWPPVANPIWRIPLISLITLTLAGLNYRGIRPATLVNNSITVIKLLLLTGFVIVGLCYVHPANFQVVKPFNPSVLLSSVLLLVFAFSGFDVASVPAGEVIAPQRTVPRSLLIAIAMVSLLYVGIQYVCIGTLPGLSQSSKPIADSARLFIGPTGSLVITIGALITMLGTLNVLMLTSSRLLFAMAEQKQLPGRLSFINQRFHTPSVAIVVTVIVILVLTISGNFINNLTISAIIRLFTFVTTCLALPLIRLKEKDRAPFSVRGGVFIAAIAILVCLLLAVNIGREEAINAFILTLVGIVLYFLCKYTGVNKA
ncbi:amino acid/polyamine/organocation transporter (APC superfamily) [Mucilaginibacter gracilis]|uniref:Amino acid/polyamine/organocation transporter (APC superfamily) n=1 Tax=Mucilaginibacter gracilis TaxID=423350 RepID=A0A495IUK2_9SPHI|nr:amino acid/polyamine/organocation transporter (APC superfamily) [Mucilaginibacter gracilis]